MTEHALKCWPEYFQSLWDGTKTLELRLNDRDFAVGDTLLQREYEPVTRFYSGRWLRCRVTHIVTGPWLAPGHIAMSVKEEARGE